MSEVMEDGAFAKSGSVPGTGPIKLHMVSLGCDKNLVDSENMLGILTARGYELTDDEQEAEVAVINTCCFIEDAKKESAAPVSVSGIERLSNRCFCQDCAYRDSKNKYEQNCDRKMLFHQLQLLFMDSTDKNELSC